jgi:uncharacterized membrane protein
MQFTPVIIAHIAAACGALFFGALTLSLRKGTRTHKLFGRIWVALMLITALVSFAIRSNGSFSWIHILSVVTLVGLAASIYAAIRGNIRAHRRGMTATYSSLVIAGVFTLLPYRRLGSIVWGAVGLI